MASIIGRVRQNDALLQTQLQDAGHPWYFGCVAEGLRLRNALASPVDLAQYRSARGLPPAPGPLEQVAIFHGQKRASLGARGLFDEVKAVLEEVAAQVEPTDAGGAALLRKVSPHWLRHAYARHLVVEAAVPLPAAQALLAHASANTTAAYSLTDLSRLREFVETGFAQ